MGRGRLKGGRCGCGGVPTCNVTPLGTGAKFSSTRVLVKTHGQTIHSFKTTIFLKYETLPELNKTSPKHKYVTIFSHVSHVVSAMCTCSASFGVSAFVPDQLSTTIFLIVWALSLLVANAMASDSVLNLASSNLALRLGDLMPIQNASTTCPFVCAFGPNADVPKSFIDSICPCF